MHLELNFKGLLILNHEEILTWHSPGKTQCDMHNQTNLADKNSRR